MKKILLNERGVTLLELIISLALLAIIIIPVSSLFIGSAKATNSTNDKMIASYIAQREMERIKSLDEVVEQDGLIENTDPEYENFSYTIETKEIDSYTNSTNESINIENKNFEINTNEGVNYELNIDKFGNYVLNGENGNNFSKNEDNEINISLEIKGDKTPILKASVESPTTLRLFVKKGQDINVKNVAGDIRVYRNYIDQNDDSTGARVYRVIIKVKKNNELLEELQGYKNIVQ